MADFIPGIRLSELFYYEAVGPILLRHYSSLRYSAALLGTGSEVLGFDTERSTDHGWGPRLQIFLAVADFTAHTLAVTETMRHQLPHQFHGYPTNFVPAEEGSLLLQPIASGPVNHRVEITTVPRFLQDVLGIDSYPDVPIVDWLVIPEQRLRELTAGAVFYDGLGEVEPARAYFLAYPHDLWLYLLAAQWKRIGQQEPFVGRCGEVGDDLGSALVASTLVRDLMRLCFLMERVYAPYSKWLGTAFARLPCAGVLFTNLQGALRATSWQERERHLTAAYAAVATMHNRLGITEPLPETVSRFHDRPFLVIDGERFARAICARITDEAVLRLPPDVGAVDQYVESTDVTTNGRLLRRLRAIYTTDPAS
jgi:hypothetical protein